MGFMWYGLSLFIHVHVIFILLAVLPFPSPRHWKAVLNVRPIRYLVKIINFDMWKLYLIMACLFLIVYLDSIRNYFKYSIVEYQLIADKETQKDARIALLEAQRNYYIAGFAFLLCLFFPRLTSILNENADLPLKLDIMHYATLVFKELMRVLHLEEEIERKGGIEVAMMQAMERELQKLHDDTTRTRERDGSAQLNDLKSILEIYERRRNDREVRERNQREARFAENIRQYPFYRPANINQRPYVNAPGMRGRSLYSAFTPAEWVRPD